MLSGESFATGEGFCAECRHMVERSALAAVKDVHARPTSVYA
jgi:hypothetical protein